MDGYQQLVEMSEFYSKDAGDMNAIMEDFTSAAGELNVLRVNQTQKLERDRITMFIKGIVDEVKAVPVEKVEGLRPGMSAIIEK